jgi:hypothetical protein
MADVRLIDAKVYNVANKDGTAFYSSGYGSRYEAEELLKISKQHDPDAHVVEYEVKTELEKMAEERAELLARIPRWISVEERLPEEKEDVAAIVRYNENVWEYGIAFRMDGSWRMNGAGRVEVTHWMKLPELPKEDT